MEGLGHVAYATGAYARAGALYGESLACWQALSERCGIAHSTSDLASVAAATGDDVRAAALYERSQAIFRNLSDKRGTAWALTGLARIASRQGNSVYAWQLLEESPREGGDSCWKACPSAGCAAPLPALLAVWRGWPRY